MYNEIFALYADLLKALAHPRRLEIVQLLREQAMNVSDIYEMLDLPQANISQHLSILREAGIIIASRKGKHIHYELANPKVVQAFDLLRDMLIEQHSDSPIAHHLKLSMKELVPVVHDPVCQMRVSPKSANFHVKHNNHQYFFCASGCLKKFKEQPEAYV